MAEDLANRLGAGDDSALADILLEFGPWASGLLNTIFGNSLSRDDIDDVLAQTLSKVWLLRENYDPQKGTVGTWFLGIAKNVAKDQIRSKHRAVRLVEGPPPESWVDFDEEECDHEPPTNAFLRDFRDFFSRLSTKEQLVATYASNSYVNGCSSWTRPVCEILGISPKNARVIWIRTKRKLRERMRELGHQVPELQEQR